MAGRYGMVLLAVCALLGKAFSALQTLDPLPKVARARTVEPPVFVDRKHLSLVMAVHPNCLYSAASLAELRKIYARMPEEMMVTLLEFTPEGEAQTWNSAAAGELAALAKLQARILTDRNGEIARRLGITKSGELKLFSPNGKLLYDGGIAGGLGTVGAGLGEETVEDIINGSNFQTISVPSFGCSLFGEPGCDNGAVTVARN